MENKSMNDLPEGMISEVLVRLPVKSLCKPWLSLISTPRFVKYQLLRAMMASMNTPTLLTIERPPPTEEEPAFEMYWASKKFLTWTSPSCELVNLQALLDNDNNLSSSPVQFDRLVMPLLFNDRHRVISVCNGLICLANSFGDHVYLWNPSIRKCMKLPAPKLYTFTSLPVKLGFGYDPISDDYKVFRVVSEKEFDDVPLVQVYSSNAHSWTTEFKAPILKDIEVYGRADVVVDGVLFFDTYNHHLISFDLHKEIFGQVPFPAFTVGNGSDVLDFHGSVAMVFESGPEIDLWTLDDVHGEVPSWTKRFSIEANPETEIWLTSYLGAGQFFGKKKFPRTFIFDVLYDCEKKETKIYKLGEEDVCSYLKYTETLISLDGFEQVQ